MHTTRVLPIGIGMAFLFACGTSDTTAPPAKASPPDAAHNSRNSLDWAGTYDGTVPATGQGDLSAHLTLHENGTYLLRTGPSEGKTVSEGTFDWDADGRNITLEGVKHGPSKYQVGEEHLLPYAPDGHAGGAPNGHVLRKTTENTTSEAPPLEGTYWKLDEIMGERVAHPGNRMPAHILLNAEGNRTAGNAGCNPFFGIYELREDRGIRFERTGSTMMSCPDMGQEEMFHRALLEADRYSIIDGKLRLGNERSSALLLFRVMDM